MNGVNEIDYREWDLECALCLEPFNDPRILACFHSFCFGCISELNQCPTCNVKFAPGDLKVDFRANTTLEKVKKLGAPLNAPQPDPQPAPQPIPQPVVVAPVAKIEPVAQAEVLNYEFIKLEYENGDHIRLFMDFVNSSHSLGKDVLTDFQYNHCFFAMVSNKQIDFLIRGDPAVSGFQSVHILGMYFSRDRRVNEHEIVQKLGSFLCSRSIREMTNRISFEVTYDNIHDLELWFKTCRAVNKHVDVLTWRGTSLTVTVSLDRTFKEKKIFSLPYAQIINRIYSSLVKIHEVEQLPIPLEHFEEEPHASYNELITIGNDEGEIEGYLVMNNFSSFRTINVDEMRLINNVRENRIQLITKMLLRTHQISDQSELFSRIPSFLVDETTSPLIKEYEDAAYLLKQQTGIAYKMQFGGRNRGKIVCEMRKERN